MTSPRLRQPLRDLHAEAARVKRIFTDPHNRGYRGELIGNYVRWRLISRPLKRELEVRLANGMKTVVYPDSDSGESSIFTMNVDLPELNFARKVLRPSDWIIDVGCNVGNRTLGLADAIAGALLIDANPVCLQRAQTNLARNGLEPSHFELVEAAAGASEGTVIFTDDGGTATSNRIVTDRDSAASSREVRLTTVDAEVARAPRPYAFLKSDAEGHDLEVLKGAMHTLQTPAMKLAMFERWQELSLGEFQDLFDSLRWVLFALDDGERPTTEPRVVERVGNLLAMPARLWEDHK